MSSIQLGDSPRLGENRVRLSCLFRTLCSWLIGHRCSSEDALKFFARRLDVEHRSVVRGHTPGGLSHNLDFDIVIVFALGILE